MPRLRPKRAIILRWLAFLPTVFGVAAAGPFGALALAGVAGDWLSLLVILLATSASVYLGSRVAPSRRGWPTIVAASLPLLALLLVLSQLSDVDSRAVQLLVMAVVGGVAVGAFLAWRRTLREPPQVLRTPEGRSLRYKGTAPFQHDDIDRSMFFGRDREVRSLLSLVLAERLVVLFGRSGMGKSSLINAGLVEPLLQRGYFPMTIRIADRARGPLGGLLDGVRTTARAAGVEIVGGDESNLWSFFKTTEFWSRSDDLLHPVLILDQFEELFTLHDREPRRHFIVQLAELLRGRAAAGRSPGPSSAPDVVAGPSKLKIVLSLREDYLADLEELARDIPGILQHRFRIGALTPENARDAIVKPAMLEHAAFETAPFMYREDALQRILTFLAGSRHGSEMVTGDEVEPAQLQLVCQYVEELVRTRLAVRHAGTRVEVSEADLGGERQLQRVLEDFYDRSLASIASPWERRRVQRLCERRLISGAGRRLTEAEEEIEKRHGVSMATLRQLVDTRLLRPEPRLGGVFYELSHDTLVGPILRSRKKRIAHTRRLGASTLALVSAGAVLWWVLVGREAYTQQQTAQAQALVTTTVPDRNDPGVFLALLNARLSAIEERRRDGLGSREGYGAVSFAAEDVGLRYPEVRANALKLRSDIAEEFNRRFGVKPVGRQEDEGLNRRILIPGGSFEMGSPEAVGASDERPRHHVTLSPFLIQEHEVTNEEYRRFDPTHGRFAPDKQPVVNVSWYEAVAYAAWLGGSLPTEAQWEFAARGKNGRTYPWGEEDQTCDRANSDECRDGLRPVKVGRDQGKTPEGIYDLAGNVWEWCRDWYGPYRGQEQTDPLGPPTGSVRVMRGGSFDYDPMSVRAAYRDRYSPEGRDGGGGFRVVWSPDVVPAPEGREARSQAGPPLRDGQR
jgi:hypothetical protein